MVYYDHVGNGYREGYQNGYNGSQSTSSSEESAPRTFVEKFCMDYLDYEYDPSLSYMQQFHAMCDHYGWEQGGRERDEAFQDLKTAMVEQFNRIFGEDENKIESWKYLCKVVGVSPIPTRLGACRRAVQEVHVNLVDLVLVGDGTVNLDSLQIFESEWDLSEYTKETGKFFPLNHAKAGGLLKFLLRHIMTPGRAHNRERRDLRTELRPVKRARYDHNQDQNADLRYWTAPINLVPSTSVAPVYYPSPARTRKSLSGTPPAQSVPTAPPALAKVAISSKPPSSRRPRPSVPKTLPQATRTRVLTTPMPSLPSTPFTFSFSIYKNAIPSSSQANVTPKVEPRPRPLGNPALSPQPTAPSLMSEATPVLPIKPYTFSYSQYQSKPKKEGVETTATNVRQPSTGGFKVMGAPSQLPVSSSLTDSDDELFGELDDKAVLHHMDLFEKQQTS